MNSNGYPTRANDRDSTTVAKKRIKLGLDSKEVLDRFEAECQALAVMNHSNITRVLDTGKTQGCQMFFVMEMVDGPAWTQYCDTNNVEIDRRLKLFCDICSGLQHANQKGVIHRDLKPSNIIVTLVDGQPVAKVVNFGVPQALATADRPANETALTGIRQTLGTFQYMSPEQTTQGTEDIDTRSDIYSLGVILYELLTGMNPIANKFLEESDDLSLRELIRETEPIRPSSRPGLGLKNGVSQFYF